MKIKTILVSSLLFSVALMLYSCNKGPYPGFKLVGDIVYMKYHLKGEEGGKTPELNDIVTVSMEYRLEDTVLFSSKEMPEALSFPLVDPTFKGDIYDGLKFMVVGDSVTVAFPVDSFYVKMVGMQELPEFVKPGDPMYFDIKLLKIQSQEEVQAENNARLLQMKEEENLLLQDYLKTNNITIEPTESGLYYIEKNKGNGRLPAPGDMLQVHFTVGLIDGMQLFSSYSQQPIDVEFGKPFDTKGFDEALGYMRKGSKATIIVHSSLAFDSVGRAQMIPPYTSLVYELELMGIRSLAEVQAERAAKAKAEELQKEQAKISEAGKISKYIRDNKINVAPSESGLYYIETLAGTGMKAEAGKSVKVHYTLYNIEGKKLQSSKDMDKPFEFVLGQGQVIKGWDEGIAYMKAGGKATLLVPSVIAYGANQRGADIPPYSPLVFEVELLEVK
ncbi:MAG: FKBP-type peptidyl-prolyl cis-trans isomerase [Bacteroidales bacterium]|nr:FKBP-type peptidyl-prolyl cis-trans isomerase [Bacteroidales bacterium]